MASNSSKRIVISRWAIVIGLGVSVGLTSIWSVGCSVVGIRTWEERENRTLHRDGSYSIKVYEPAIIASTTVEGGYREMGSAGFRKLGGYIFGGNQEGRSIAMTMPVEMAPEAGDDPSGPASWEMAFFLPRRYAMDDLPAPEDESVRIERADGVTLAVYRYTWRMRDGDIASHAPGLIEWAREQGYEPIGPARLLAYDPPFTIPFLRRNEVVVPVRELQSREAETQPMTRGGA